MMASQKTEQTMTSWCALGTIAGVHEVKNNKVALIVAMTRAMTILKLMKVLESGPDGDPGAKHQGREMAM